MKNKTVIFALLICWAFVAFIVGVRSAKADEVKCSGKVDSILVEKGKKKLTLLDTTNCPVKIYDVRLGKEGQKHCEGDMKTPTGIYHIIDKRNSKYVKFLELNYPNKQDKQMAKELGCNPGSAIGIHSWIEGLPKENSQGCITVWTKDEILEINSLVKVGTKVEITND